MDRRRIIGEVPRFSRLVDSRSFILGVLRDTLLILLVGDFLGAVATQAQNATWLNAPGSNLWDDGTNWTGGAVPTGTAIFGQSTVTNITAIFNPQVGTLKFNAGAPAYTFNVNILFRIIGAGIVNLSSNSPTFTAINGGDIRFLGSSTAGTATISVSNGGRLLFRGGSTGGQARLITNGGGNTDISSVSSGGATAGSIEGAGFYELGSKTFTVGLNNLSTEVSGTIDGTTGGSLIKVGTGTLILSGNNTYSGGTTVSEGVLSVAVDANLGAVSGRITLDGGELLATGGGLNTVRPVAVTTNGGTLAAAAAGFADLEGNITGSGVLTIGDAVNTGTVILGGTNTYLGSTTIVNGATLRATSTAALSPASAFIVIGTLDLNGFSNQIGSLAGTGTVTNGDSVAVVLTTGADNTDTSFSGILQDGTHLLGLTKIGSGTLTLSGANTYSGGTVIDGGTLLVDNAQALGTGNVTVNGGILAADPQPIKVKGNYTQGVGGTLQLQVAGANPGQYDSLNVGGNAFLGGTLQLISLGFQPKAGNELTLVTTGGVVSGRFAQFVNPFTTGPAFTTVDLVYGRNSVLLEFLSSASPVAPVTPVIITTDFTSFAFTPNQSAAANLLDAVQLDPRAAKFIAFLNTEPFGNLPDDLEKVSPDGLTSFYEISFSNANIQKLNLESRLDDIHNGSSGFSSNMKVNDATVNFRDRADVDGKSSKAVVEPILQRGPENRWGVWVTGFGDFVNVDGDGNAPGYNFTTGGVSLGLDYRITDQLAIGVMGEYSHTCTELSPGGHIDVDSGRGGVYATWFSHGFYINSAIYGGHNNYDSGRAGLGGLANCSTEGSEWSTFIGGGYDFRIAQLTVGPIASLQYTDVGIDSFDEKGSLAPLAIHSDSAESLRSDVGFRVFYQWQIGKIIVEPSLKAAWEHEYKYSALPITAGFAGIPGPSATFFGPSEGHDSAVVNAGVSVQVTPVITTYVNYDGQLGRCNYDSNAVTGGVRISF